MRKSFTRLFGLFVLFSMLSWQVAAQIPTPTLSPDDHTTITEKGMSTFKVVFPAGTTIEANSGAGIISLNEYDGVSVQLDPQQVTFGSASNFINGNVITVTFDSELLEEQAWYYITISPDAFLVNDEPWGGILANPAGYLPGSDALYVWDFQYGDFTPPTAELFPPDNSINAGNRGTGVEPNTDLKLMFEEPVRVIGGGTIALYNANGNVVDFVVLPDLPGAPTNSGVSNGGNANANVTLSVSEDTIIVSGLNNIEPLTEYYVRISEGSIVDLAGNDVTEILGTNDNTTWNFMSADNQAPEITSEDDLQGKKDVAQAGEFKFTLSDDFGFVFNGNTFDFTAQTTTSLYDEEHTPDSDDIETLEKTDLGSLFTLTGGAGSLLTGSSTVSGDGTVITLKYKDLETHTDYSLAVNGNSVVNDGSGNMLPDTTFTFTSGDFTAPQFVEWPTSNTAVTRNGNNNQKLDVNVDSTMINDRAAAQNGMYSEPLDLYMKVVDYNATAPDAPANPENAGWTVVPYDEDDKNYALEGANFGLDCDKQYDIYFYAIDAVGNAFNDDSVATTLISGFWSTDNCIAFPEISFSEDLVSGKVDRSSNIILTFEEIVKAAGNDWTQAITITVPNGTLDDGSDDDPDEISFTADTAIVDGETVLTLTETHFDRYEGDTNGADYATLLSDVEYTVTINKDKILDHAADNGNGTDNKLGKKQYSFETEDYEGPIATYEPADSSGVGDPTKVDIDVNPVISFNEPIFDENGDAITSVTAVNHFELIEVGGSNPNVIIEAEVNEDGTKVTLIPQSTLKSEQLYRIKITELVYDENGFVIFNYDDGLTNATATDIEGFSPAVEYMTSVFETEDTKTPLVTFNTTAPGLTNVGQSDTVIVVFDEVIRETAGGTAIVLADNNMIRSLISLKDPAGDEIQFNIVSVTTPSSDSTMVKINPIDYPDEYLFTLGETYTVSVSGVEDDNGNAVTDSASFSIIPEEDPVVIELAETDPIEDSTVEIDQNSLTLTFSTTVDALTGNITVTRIEPTPAGTPESWDVSANLATGYPDVQKTVWKYDLPAALLSLDDDATYEVTIDEASFVLPNDASVTYPATGDGDYTFEFSTVDETGPTIVLEDDVDVTVGVNLDSVALTDVLEFTFADPDNKVIIGEGNFWIKRVDNGNTVVEWDQNSSAFSVTDNVFEVDLSYVSTLALDTDYFIEMDDSLITDETGNPFMFSIDGGSTFAPGGFFSDTVMTFTTWDDTPEVYYADMDPAADKGWFPVRGSNDVDADALNYLYIPFTAEVKINPDVLTDNNYRLVINDSNTQSPSVSIPANTTGLIKTVENDTKARISVAAIEAYAAAFEFVDEENYWIDLTDGTFVKATGSPMEVDSVAGAVEDSISHSDVADGWYFTTKDFTDPKIASVEFDPANDGSSVAEDAEIIVNFTEPVELVDASTNDWDSVFTFDPYVAAAQDTEGLTATGTGNFVTSGDLSSDGMYVTLTMDDDFELDADFRTITMIVKGGTYRDLSPAQNENVGSSTPADEFEDVDDETFVIVDKLLPEPEFTTLPASALDGTSVDIEVDVTEDATVWVLAVKEGSTMPNQAAMQASTHTWSVDISDSDTKEYTYTGLDECEEYDFYIMAEDLAGNISDAVTGTNGNQPVEGANTVSTADITAPLLSASMPTYPINGETIDLFTYRYLDGTTYTENNSDTPLKIFFNEKVKKSATAEFVVREYETNVAVSGLDVTIEDDTVVVIRPANGVNWEPNSHYYVETAYGSITDDASSCASGASDNDWAGAFYGKEQWHFHTGPVYTQPDFVDFVYPKDSADQVIFSQPDTMIIEYSGNVDINYGVGNIYIYRYDDLGANPQEIIPVQESLYPNVWADGTKVYIRVAHLLNNQYKEHYRVVLPDSMVIDANYDENDVTTHVDYTPLHANTNDVSNGGDINYDLGSDGHLDGPFWDFWALDVASPDLFWTSVWVNEFEGNRYYETEDDRLVNFPTRDHTSSNTVGPNADNSDTEVGNADDYPDRTIYLNFNEKLYYYDTDPMDALNQGDDLEDFFAAGYIDEEGDTIELDKDSDFDVVFDSINNRAVFTFNDDLIGSTDYMIALLDESFADVDNNVLGDDESTEDVVEGSSEFPYEFTTWLDESPTVSFDVELADIQYGDNLGRATSQPKITVTFNRPVLIADIYQTLEDEDVLDLFLLEENISGGAEIELTIVENSEEDVYVLQPADELNSEMEYVFTVVSDGTLETGGVDIDLVDNVRTYSRNGNLFIQDLEDRQFEFTVEDYEEPTNTTATFYPNATNDVVPANPMGSFATGNFIAVQFGEDVELGTSTEPIVIRRAWASGPQSEGAGSIFQRTYISDLSASNIDDNVLYIPVTGGEDAMLEDFTGYNVNIPADFIQDMAGLSYAGIETGDKTTWAFSTDDGTEPRVISAYPQIWDESMFAFDHEDRDDLFTHDKVSKSVDFRLQFDENIERGTGNIVLYKRDFDFTNPVDGNVVGYIPVTDGAKVIIEGSDPNNGLTSDVLIIKHPVLEPSMNYYIRYEEGIVKDSKDNNIAARNVAGDFTWDFNTSDHEIPEIADLDPNDGEVVSQEPVLTMTFEEEVPVQLGSGNLRIYEYFYVDGTIWDSRLITTIDITDESQVTMVDSANAVVIDPSVKLPDNKSKLYVLVDASAVTNTTTLDQFAGIADDEIWYFGTEADETAPVLDTVTTNIACGVAPGEITATIELTDFNGIAAGTGNFEVYFAADSTLAFEVPASDARVEFVNDSTEFDYIEKSTATITFDAADLVEETAYYIVVGDSAIFDNSNADVPNVFDGSVVSDWNFTVNDFTAPVAMLDIDTDFTASDSLVVTIKFSEEVQVGSAPDFVIATAADSVEVFTYTITEENINNEDSTVTIVVDGLDDMTDYYMAYDSSFVNDMTYGECTDVRAVAAVDANTWTFNTGDNTAPTAEVISPVLAETPDTVLVIEFSEPVNVVDLSGFVVVNGDSVMMTSTDSLTYSGILEGLPSETTVEVVFPEGSFKDSIVGSTQNAIADGTVLTFEVKDILAPNAEYLPSGVFEDYYKEVELRMTFDDNVDAIDGKNVYLVEETGDTIQIIEVADFNSSNGDSTYKYTTDLPGYGSYYVLADYGSFVDVGDNVATIAQNYEGITADTVWAFEVVDTYFDPCVEGFDPVRVPGQSEKDVETTTTISLTFCGEEAIFPPIRSGRFISIGDQADEQVEDENFFNFLLADSMIDGTTLTLEVSGLKENTTYSITIAEGAVTDEAGNEFEGITNANDWIFTTGDFTPPVATLVEGSSVEGDDADATMTSTENGTLYLVEEGVAAEVTVMDAAIDDNKVVKVSAIANNDVTVDVSGLVAGNYNAVAVDAKGNVSAKSDNTFVIDDAPVYPVLTIAQIQGTGDTTPYEDEIVVTSGTVTGVDEDGKGFFMQDANDVRSGIYVYDADLAANVGIGTSVKVTATATEHFTLTQLKEVIAYEFTGKVVEVEAIEISASEMGEEYEGVLVKVDSLKTTDLPNEHGEWTTTDTENDVVVKIDEQLFTFVPDAGQRYDITGVCNYTFNEYKLAPRNLEDIEFVSGIKMLDINIDIYPNPFDTYVKFDVSRDVEITKAVITNIAGQLVKQVDYPANTIRTDELRSGVYFISLQTAEGIAKTERIIKR